MKHRHGRKEFVTDGSASKSTSGQQVYVSIFNLDRLKKLVKPESLLAHFGTKLI